MEDYKGWVLPNRVTVIKSQLARHQKGNISQAYIVSEDNKSQLKTAKEWAGGKYEELELDNKDFKLEILESAHNSSQSGKLSFWNCLIKQNSLEFIVGINSDLLLEIIRENIFINGICQEQLMFIRKSGRLGMVHEGMSIYKDYQSDIQYKEKMHAEQIKQLESGRVYTSLRKSDIFICEVYQWFKFNKEGYQILKKPIKMKLFIDKYKLDGILRDISNIESISSLFEGYTKYNSQWYTLFDSLIKSTPRRIAGERILKSDNFEEQFKGYQLSVRKHSKELYDMYLAEKSKNSMYSYSYSLLDTSIRHYLSSCAITLNSIDFNRELVYKELVNLYSDSKYRFILED